MAIQLKACVTFVVPTGADMLNIAKDGPHGWFENTTLALALAGF